MSRPSAPAPWIPPADRPARILLVRLSALGDVLHALPVLAALRAELPEAEIDWVVEDRAADLLRDRPELTRVVILPRRALKDARRRPWVLAGHARSFLATLQDHRYDVALDLQGNLKSGIVTRLARARHRYGLDGSLAREGNHLFTTRRAHPAPHLQHRVERNLALLGAMLGHPVAWRDPGWVVPPEVESQADRLLTAAGLPLRGFVLLHPGTSRFGAFKRWPAARFADLAHLLLAQRGDRVVVSAPPGEEDLAAAIAEHAGDAVRVLPIPSLALLGAVTKRARLFVAGDTGPLHLAALAGTPLLGLYGPKDPAIYGPYGQRPDGTAGVLPILVREDVACRPCRLRECPDPICMTGLTAEAALEATSAR